MAFFPQSIARRVPFKAYLASDHVSAATGKTIAITISKNGAAFANPSAGATNATEIGNGWYYVDLSTTDFNTLGPLIIRGAEGSIDTVERLFEIVNATNAGYSALPNAAAEAAGGLFTRGSSAGQINQDSNGRINVNLIAVAGTTQTARDFGAQLDVAVSTRSSSSEVTAIQNNTRVVIVVPEIIERPDSGTVTYRIELYLYDTVGNMEAPDSDPVIALVNQSGTDLSSRLDSTTMANVSTGRYRAIYTASAADAIEQLVWTFSIVEGGATKVIGRGSLIVDTTAVDFTSADRAKLDTLHDTRLTAQRAINLDNLDSLISSRASQTSVTTIDDLLDTEIGSIITHLVDIKGLGFTSSHSLESIRNRGDTAWTTATGFATVATIFGSLLADHNIAGSIGRAINVAGAGIAGKVSGAGTATETFKRLDSDVTLFTVAGDSSGNRTTITFP